MNSSDTHTRLRRTLVLSCVLSLVGACGGRDAVVRSEVSRIDSAGVEIVINRAPAWHRDSGWRVDSVPITVIGGNTNDPSHLWTYIVGARRLSDGRVVVATDQDVRWFSTDGVFIAANARTGDGPGEFRYRSGLLRLSGDTIVVADPLGTRVATFSPDGELLRDDRVDLQRIAALGRWGECNSGLLPDGSRYTCAQDTSIPLSATNRPNRMIGKGWSSPGPGLLRQLRRTYLLSPSLDTAYKLGMVAGIEQFGYQRGAEGILFLIHPFYSHSLLGAGGSPMRIASMLNPEYRIEVWTPTGTLERIVTREVGRRVATADERRQADAYTRKQERKSADPVLRDAALAAMPVPDSLPAASGLLISTLGELIVARDGQFSDHNTYDVFDRSGRWLGTFSLPVRTFIIEVGSDYVLVMRRDEDEVSTVEVRRLYRDGVR